MPPKVVYRPEAQELSLTKYYTGLPCICGHRVERFTCSGVRVECARKKAKEKRVAADPWKKERKAFLLEQTQKLKALKQKPQVIAPEDSDDLSTVSDLCNFNEDETLIDS